MTDQRADTVVDRNEIEYLQRLYAKATDKLGKKTPELREEGRRSTYLSKVRRGKDGWQIYDMTLRLDTSGNVQTT